MAVLTLALALTGCTPVVTSRVIGTPSTQPMAQDLQGDWLRLTPVNGAEKVVLGEEEKVVGRITQISVSPVDSATGQFAVKLTTSQGKVMDRKAWIRDFPASKGRDNGLTGMEFLVTVDIGTADPHLIWGLVVLTPTTHGVTAQAWLPNSGEFEKLLKSGTFPGTVDSGNVTLGELTNEQVAKLGIDGAKDAYLPFYCETFFRAKK